MILRRLGNKAKIAKKIQAYFPPHKIYIEPFFGAGGMFFNKPKAHNNILNDLDSDVFNLFQVVMSKKEALEEAFSLMPVHSDLLKYWKLNKETEPIRKALRFLFLSNFTLLGNGGTLAFKTSKNEFYSKFKTNLDLTYKYLFECYFHNIDFEKFIKSIQFYKDGRNDKEDSFIYNDPIYLGTTSNYESKDWNKSDVIRLFDANEATGCKFAYSEFDNDFVIAEAEKRGLNIHIIGERKNLKNRRTEILITNYQKQKTLFE